jgi:hypothetical protein
VEADDGYASGDLELVKTRSGVFHPEGGVMLGTVFTQGMKQLING